ncbi:MAG: hypothetical protein FJ115_12720 [Deltaproteobacteria bacterium]|nr:hypothetical protein [Deltaproteobacteria bacterium]MBM4324416.1 hypothetical protein [Deltaproteobacteria bacterium]
MISHSSNYHALDLSFLYFVLFSFVLIALILFILYFIDGLKEIKEYFRWRQYIIYVLGSLFILASFSLSYFLYLHGSLWLALSVLVIFNGVAAYFFFKASNMISDKNR